MKQLTEAMMFMGENGFKSYDDLLESIKADKKRLQKIAVFKTHIANYSKTKDVFAEYKKSGYSRKFFEKYRDVLTHRKVTKNAFDKYKEAHGAEAPFSTSKELSTEYAGILFRKKQVYAECRKLKSEPQEYYTAKRLVENIMGMEEQEKEAK